MDLAKLLANRRWLWRRHPFPHFYAAEVFVPAFYAELDAAYRELLGRGFGSPEEHDRFTRSISGYDVYALALHRGMPAALHVFFSRALHDVLASVTGVRATGDLNGALHHHPPGSLSGRPHNDLNPGWFLDAERPGEVNLSDPRRCNYHTGAAGGLPVHETIRGAALLFYLANPPWRPGDGGETGLYASAAARTEEPVVAVPPLNNSLLLFECTPRSFHAFIRNRTHPRNSVVLWIHRAKEEVIARWGRSAIVGWEGPRVLNEPG